MSKIRIKSIKVKNYRSFKEEQFFKFPDENYKKPVAIIGYNNAGKTNLMNCILYGLQINFISKDTFSINDFHKRDIDNIPQFILEVESSTEEKFEKDKSASLSGFHRLEIFIDEDEIEGSKMTSLKRLEKIFYDGEEKDDINWNSFGAGKYFNIFYINFHNIKEEISTQKTSWGNLKSFLAKHIKKLVDGDEEMSGKKEVFEGEMKMSTKKVLKDSKLNRFIESIKNNYIKNLRENNFEVEFGLPNYEDIFLQMMFKVGLNGDKNNLVPINHFGDGYISMFVMAVIKAIAETNPDDQCLFLFEEPESFLHENHQEYFYKMVLCELSKKHQVIYTTHSAKMIDIFNTEGLIRLEINEDNETIKKYNNVSGLGQEAVDMSKYNDFIRTIEPNLNKILFSKKVVLVEGPNDAMVYKYCIQKRVVEKIASRADIVDKEKYAETYLNFENISIIPHHGKSTALYLMKVCKHFDVDYFVINDWDFKESELSFLQVSKSSSLEEFHKRIVYINGGTSARKGMMTTNWKLISEAGSENIHFNIEKLEKVIGYDSDDKDSLKIWETINRESFCCFNEKLFPKKLEKFLMLEDLERGGSKEDDLPGHVNIDDVPF